MIGPPALCAKKAITRYRNLKNFSLDKASVRSRSLRSTSSGENHSSVKRKKKSEHWKPVKDKYNSNRFTSTILKYWKVICIQRKRNCKGSISPIIKLLNEHSYKHQSGALDTYSSKKKRKKEKEEKGLLRDIFVWCFPVGLTFCHILKRKEKKNCFLNLIIICSVIAY